MDRQNTNFIVIPIQLRSLASNKFFSLDLNAFRDLEFLISRSSEFHIFGP